jgi:hypothetical protein
MQGYDKNSKLTKMTAASTNLWYTTGQKLFESFIVIWVTNNFIRTFQNFYQILMQKTQCSGMLSGIVDQMHQD